MHSTSPDNLDVILRKGITSGDIRGSIGTGTGVATQTPLCADFWEVQQATSIKDYFYRLNFNCGEANFLPRTNPKAVKVSNTHNAMVFVVDKRRLAPTLKENSFMVKDKALGSILYKDGNMLGHSDYITHRAIPIGVPANSISKIIIRKECYSPNEIQEIKNKIISSGRNIELYDLAGNLL